MVSQLFSVVGSIIGVLNVQFNLTSTIENHRLCRNKKQTTFQYKVLIIIIVNKKILHMSNNNCKYLVQYSSTLEEKFIYAYRVSLK